MITQRRILLLLTSLLGLLPLESLAEPQPTQVSTGIFTLDLTPPDPFSAWSADRMVALPDGTRFVLGSGVSNSAALQYLLKIRPDGTQAWAAPVASLWSSDMKGLAVDASGNAYVAYTDFSDFSQPHARVVKYNAVGGIAASADLTTDTTGGDGFPFSAGVGVDPIRGRVYAAYSFFSIAQRQDTFAITAFDTALQTVAGPLIHDPGFTGSFLGPDPNGGTFVDGNGEVWVVGVRVPPGEPSGELFAAHFGPNLVSAAVTALPSWSAEEVVAAADPRGGVVVAGDRPVDGNLYLHRVTAGGFGPAFRFDGFDFGPMTVDPSGNLYILGYNPDTFIPAVAKINTSNVLAWDQPGPSLDLPSDFAPGAVSAASSTTFDVANIAYGSDPSPVVLLHYQQSTGTAPANLALAALSPTSQDATVTKPLAAPLRVKVTEGGTPKQGVMVRWDFISLPSGTAGQDILEAPGFPSTVVASRDVPTDAHGESAVQVKLGDKTGDYLIAAQVSNATPSQVSYSLHGKLFLSISLSTGAIKPVPFTQTVSTENQVAVTAHAFGIGGSSDAITSYPLVLISTALVFSGGHDHASGRPDGTFSGSNLAVYTSLAAGRTDASGNLFAVFTSTYFGGDELFYASSTVDAGVVSVSTSLIIKTGDFILLSTASYYTLRGGTCLHHGPQGPTDCVSPDQDHFGTAATAASIATAAAQWFNKHPALELVMNDMSLPLGGGFDIGGHWSGDIVRNDPRPSHCNAVGHCGHRDGRTVDIEVNPHNSPQSLAKKLRDELRDALVGNGATHINREGSHWHVQF